MNRRLAVFSRQYNVALQKRLKQGASARTPTALRLGRRAVTLGLETLDLARIHERALITLVLPSNPLRTRDAMIRRAGAFFADAIKPIEETHRTAREANLQLEKVIATLRRRSEALASSNRQLKREIVQRRVAEAALRKSEQHYGSLLEKSRQMQEQLRHLSRQILFAQEEDRKMISRELHDEVAQTLTGINVQLAALTTEATDNTKGLRQKIASTQRLVAKSVSIVHQFARELRPALLDDLGLIPALHSFTKDFVKRTRIRLRLTVFAGVEKLDNAKRTVLYRVAQEALTNVGKHAKATRVDVKIQQIPAGVRMEIKDDGRSFQVQRVFDTKRNTRLGLLGMRERVEMVGGSFNVRSAPGRGTAVRVEIPLRNGALGGRRGKPAD